MSDITGSVSLGDGFSLKADVNPSTSNPSATVYLEFYGVQLADVTLNSQSTSASIGGGKDGYTAKGTVTANWKSDNITYDVKISGFGSSKTYTGTLVSWSS